MMPFILWGWVMQDFKLLTRQLLETYLGSDTLSKVEIQDFLDSNASVIGTGKQEFFKNIEHFLNSFKFDVEKRKNINFEFKDLEIEENIVDDQCVFVYGSVQIYGLYDKEVPIMHLDSRFTVVYGVRDGKWKVLHIHHSIPDKEQLEDEEFPITLGKQVQQARHEVEALSAGYSYICLINLETGDVELIKGNNIPGLNGRYTQIDHNILLEQVNRLITEPFRQSSVEFYDSTTIAKRLEGKNSLFHTCERTDGTWILSMIVPQKYDENGRVVSVLLANRDFTEEKKRELEQEEALRQEKIKAEKANEAKSIFLFNMSHDIRTPMNAIIGMTSLIRHDAGNKDKVIEYADKIAISSQHLLGIINDVLDMSKIEAGKTVFKYSDFSILDAIEELNTIFHSQANEKNQSFIITKENLKHEWVNGDKVHLMQIFSNLLSNAIKYTQEGGIIQFIAEESETNSSTYGKYHFIVSDNGMGMSADFKETIFDAFTRAESSVTNKIQGTGLGMAITKNLVESMGGTIEVESEPNRGSSFEVILNLKIVENRVVSSTEQIEMHETDSDILDGMRILCAEDNELNAEILMELLKLEGAECTICENGKRILEAFEQSVPGEYDMILMDVQMPVMNGYEATEAIRRSSHEQAKTIPIIAMTANAFSEDMQHSLAAGMNAHISKPVDMKLLKKTIRNIKLGREEAQFIDQ